MSPEAILAMLLILQVHVDRELRATTADRPSKQDWTMTDKEIQQAVLRELE